MQHCAVDATGITLSQPQADAPKEAEALRQRVAERFDCIELCVGGLTPAMGASAGPRLLGVALCIEWKEEPK